MLWLVIAILCYLIGGSIAYNEGYKDAISDFKEFIDIEEVENNN